MTKKGRKQKAEKEPVKENDSTKTNADDEEEVNSGFGSYIASTAGRF